MGKMMKLGDRKWPKKQTGEGTVKTRKAGVIKGQGWVQGGEEERRDKQRNREKGYDDLCVIVSTYWSHAVKCLSICAFSSYGRN